VVGVAIKDEVTAGVGIGVGSYGRPSSLLVFGVSRIALCFAFALLFARIPRASRPKMFFLAYISLAPISDRLDFALVRLRLDGHDRGRVQFQFDFFSPLSDRLFFPGK
jgi:hypothetical protein